ncbi:hypothetical protein Lgra_2301 [Legionella gratiana]|uniref:Uncharacterized protein n=1 Tax=Legionella gratiana TaxID=45066 RepID=A0A378JLV5_9GAMM|nr:hypothetical protein [Legionella gratiana]KTD09066.1 hypothetical protein Lgra_2301 [Legionella gratiana]STX45720.1 Uncharacterised protein [Legionella gratiana]
MSNEKHNKFQRLFSGKHGEYRDLTVGKVKSEGAEIGAFFSCSKTHSEKQEEKINFLGKFITKPVEEKIYMDIVGYFSNAPSTRLACFTEEIVKECSRKSTTYSWMKPDEFEYEVWMGGLRNRYPKVKEEYLTYLSKLVPGYRNLEDYKVNDLNEKINFKDYIEKYHKFPSSVIINDQEYPLTGIMKNAAVALFIGDKDWLGGSCKNTGAYIENINGTDCAVTINIDAGFAADTDIEPFKISKNVIPYNANYSSTDESKDSIHIDMLSPELRNEFLQALYLIVHRYPENDIRMDHLLEAIVRRNGAFNDPSFDHEILTDENAIKIIDKLKNRINELRETFSVALQEYAHNNVDLLNELVHQAQEKDLEFLHHIQETHEEQTSLRQEQIPNEPEHHIDSDEEIFIEPDENSVNPITPGKSTWSDLFNSINWKKFGIASIGTAAAVAAVAAFSMKKSF